MSVVSFFCAVPREYKIYYITRNCRAINVSGKKIIIKASIIRDLLYMSYRYQGYAQNGMQYYLCVMCVTHELADTRAVCYVCDPRVS